LQRPGVQPSIFPATIHEKGEKAMNKTSVILLSVFLLGLIFSGCSLLGGEEPTATPQPAAPQEDVSSNEEPEPVETEEPQAEEPAEPESTDGIPKVDNLTYPVVDTGQMYCYDAAQSIPCPAEGEAFSGQDGQYPGIQPNYYDNGDGTITDLNTGLMWPQNSGQKMTYAQATAGAAAFNLGGYSDWRLPTIKELYSLIVFSGTDPGNCEKSADCPDLVPFITSGIFDFQYGNPETGERLIDAQYISSTPYIGQGAGGELVFGVNFADGRIKGYGTGPMEGQEGDKAFFVLYVRGDSGYGVNQFVDNGDGTVTDEATGLTWMQTDSQQAIAWQEALATCQDLSWAGFEDWRLPNAKELQSIVDYSRSPDTTNSAAIASLFNSTPLTNEAGNPDYGFYWTSTTHVNRQTGGNAAAYLAFGRALGYMGGAWVDVHGAGSQRSDPKAGDPGMYPTGRGPQGDAIRILNFARCVRGGLTGDMVTGSGTDPMEPSAPEAAPGITPTVSVPDQGNQDNEYPPEAYEACEGQSANTACQYDIGFGPTDGACRDVFGQLVCLPGWVVPTLPSP
jgi:hypothetical protein